MTDRPIRVRRHPGLHNTRPLEDDLLNAWACVTWGSGAGIKALAAGIPVYYEMEHWIGADGAQPTRGADIEHPVMGNRQSMLSRVSWAQWAAEEIQSGEALAVLLSCEKQLSISLPEMPAQRCAGAYAGIRPRDGSRSRCLPPSYKRPEHVLRLRRRARTVSRNTASGRKAVYVISISRRKKTRDGYHKITVNDRHPTSYFRTPGIRGSFAR